MVRLNFILGALVNRFLFLTCIGFLFLLFQCRSDPKLITHKNNNKKNVKNGISQMENKVKPHRFLALGDSYTIGECVAESERWPVQLVSGLRKKNIHLQSPEIIAKTGWTTDELNQAIEEKNPQGPYDFVSLLIGVNNQYRNRTPENYRQEFVGLLEKALAFAGGKAERVLVISIPDWGQTPFAEGNDRNKISKEIDQYNQINLEESQKRKVPYCDITPISRKVQASPTLVASDTLHPSGEMYTEWTALILEKVATLFQH